MESLDEMPGHSALTRYRQSHSGIDLFRAYLERREADRQRDEARVRELEARLPGMGLDIPIAEFEEIATELLRLRILQELDPIIDGVLKGCENTNNSSSAQYSELRSALRIDSGHALVDITTAERQRVVIAAWVSAYSAMPSTGHLSQNAVAKIVSKETGISTRQAINIWVAFLRREPWQAKWKTEVEWLSKRPAKAIKPARKPCRIQRKKLNFGKGRAKP